MATYTFVDVRTSEAQLLADLTGIAADLRCAMRFAQMLRDILGADRPDMDLVDALSTATVIRYARPFVGGVRTRLAGAYLDIFTQSQRTAHDRLYLLRDKHIAHSINAYEENQPRAHYCPESVNEEGVGWISCSHARVVGLSQVDIADVLELAAAMLSYVEAQIASEERRLLEIVRKMPLDDVLGNPRSAFCVDHRTSLERRRPSIQKRKQ